MGKISIATGVGRVSKVEVWPAEGERDIRSQSSHRPGRQSVNEMLKIQPFTALVRGELESAISAYGARGPALFSNPNLAADYLSLASNLGNEESMKAVIPGLLETEHRIFAVGQALKLDIEAGRSVEGAIAECNKHLRPGEAELLSGALRKFPLGKPVAASDHIAICGISFCGSTLMDRILGSLDEVESIGESHWLTKAYGSNAQGPLNILEIRPGKAPMCSQCGADCEVLTSEFRTALAVNPVGWYDKIAERLGTKILVSADKNLPKLLRHDPFASFIPVIVFKSPAQAWISRMDKLPPNLTESEMRSEFDKWIDIWTRSYRQFFKEFKSSRTKVFFDFDRFSHGPAASLEALLGALGLHYDSSVLQTVSVGHSIGGNARTARSMRSNDGEIKIVGRDDSKLPKAHRLWLNERVDAAGIYSELVDGAINR